jgi:hypothetical protein
MKSLRITAGTLLIVNMLSISGLADQTNYNIGKVGASELKIGLGARPVAMGEAFVAQADDLNTTAWNPAGLSQVQGLQAGFMHDIYLQNTALEYLAYAQNVFTNAGIGVNVMLLNFGQMDKIDENANAVGTFTPTVFSAAVGYGQWLAPWFAAGGAVKFYNENIDSNQSSAVAVDLGALIKTGLDGLQFGLAIQNLGSKVKDADLPMNAKVGLAYNLPIKLASSDQWTILADVNVPFGDTAYTSGNIGTEYWFSQVLAARVGYQIKNTGDLEGLNGLTAGLGVRLPVSEAFNMNVDYALATFGDLGLSHQIMLSVSFK